MALGDRPTQQSRLLLLFYVIVVGGAEGYWTTVGVKQHSGKNGGRAFEMPNGRRTPLKRNGEAVIPELWSAASYVSNIILLLEETPISY